MGHTKAGDAWIWPVGHSLPTPTLNDNNLIKHLLNLVSSLSLFPLSLSFSYTKTISKQGKQKALLEGILLFTQGTTILFLS